MLLIEQDPHAWECCIGQKAIRTQALLVDAVFPPMPHQLRGHKLFDLVAKLNRSQIRALFEGRLIDFLDGGGYHDAYQRASLKCPRPNLLQPIVENRCRQSRATEECSILDRPDGGGYVDACKGPASCKCILPNLLQSMVENRGRQPRATPECPVPDRLHKGGGERLREVTSSLQMPAS